MCIVDCESHALLLAQDVGKSISSAYIGVVSHRFKQIMLSEEQSWRYERNIHFYFFSIL